MNILLISENFYPEENAPGKRLFDHAKEWVKLGNKVTVLTSVPDPLISKVFPGYKNKIYQSEEVDGIKIIRVWTFITKNKKSLLFRTINFLSFMFTSLFFGLLIKKYDKLIVSSPPILPIISGFLISRIKRIPFVLEIRDLWPESIVALGLMKENSFIIKSLYVITKYIYRKSELIVVVTKTFKEYLTEMGINKDKIVVIENGFNFERTLTPNKNINLIKKQYNIKDADFIISYIGTIGIPHGLEIILKSAERLNNVLFLVIGEGTEKKSLKKIKEQKKIKNVLFIDNIDWQEIVNINQIIDANLIHLQNLKLFKTVLPSKMFESMALKKPILAGLIGESIEIITKSNSGLKIIPENPNSLVENILHLRSNPEMSKIMGNNGFNLVKKKYNRKVLAYKMIQTIDTI